MQDIERSKGTETAGRKGVRSGGGTGREYSRVSLIDDNPHFRLLLARSRPRPPPRSLRSGISYRSRNKFVSSTSSSPGTHHSRRDIAHHLSTGHHLAREPAGQEVRHRSPSRELAKDARVLAPDDGAKGPTKDRQLCSKHASAQSRQRGTSAE